MARVVNYAVLVLSRLALTVCLCSGFGCELAERTADAPDAGPTRDASSDIGLGPEPPPFAGLPSDGSEPEQRAEDPDLASAPGGFATDSCYDGVDDDEASDGVDCEDPGCRSLGSCCLADLGCVAPAVSLVSRDVATCEDERDCVTGAALFGSPRPYLEMEGLALGGDTEYDSGLLVASPVDLRSARLTITSRFAYGDCTGCLETAALGVTRQEELGDTDHVQALVALQLTMGHARMQLLIAGRFVASYALGAEAEPWSLTLSPDGTVEVRHGDAVVGTDAHVPLAGTRVVVWGHSVNAGPTGSPRGVRLETLEVATRSAEVPTAWRTRRPLPEVTSPATRVSATTGSAGARVVVEGVGAPQFYTLTTGESDTLQVEEWEVAADGMTAGAHDFALSASGDSLFLYYLDELGNLHRMVLVGDEFQEDSSAGLAAATYGWTDVHRPAVLHHRDHEIVIVEQAGALAGAIRGPRTSGVWEPLSESLAAASAGFTHPSLIVQGDTYELHYASLRGTASTVGLLASDALLGWRSIEGEALLGSGERDAFDRFGARSPAALSFPGEVVLLYLGDDLVRTRLGIARRDAPAGRRR